MTTADSNGFASNRTTLEAKAFREQRGSKAAAFEFTIVFHPLPSHIGWRARLETDRKLQLGRSVPVFSDISEEFRSGLDDPFISRNAFELSKSGRGWMLKRRPGKSLLHLDGVPVHEPVMLTEAALWRGVVLNLANRVVLHCRLIDRDSFEAVVPAPIDGLLGESPAMHALRRRITAIAQTGSDVLVLGPTGVGKDVAARAIHHLSRAKGPLIAVNMAALPVELAAASLFGAAKGAYTGADRYRKGYFEEALEGTLFLDEIGDTPAALQPMLLRALQQREIQVVGGPSKTVTTRVIAATELDPDDESTALRASLRYRLAAEELTVPTLDKHREDIGVLALACITRVRGENAWRSGYAESDNQLDQVNSDQRTEDLMHWVRFFEGLALRKWPGNIRELEHYLSSCLRASEGVPVAEDSLVERDESAVSEPSVSCAVATPDLADMTEAVFFEHWQSCNFEVAAVAKRLGVSRSAVYRRLHGSNRCRLAADVPLGELLAALDDCRGNLKATAERLSVSKRGLSTRLRAAGVQLPRIDDPSGAAQ